MGGPEKERRSREGMVSFGMDDSQGSGLGEWRDRCATGQDSEYREWCSVQGKVMNSGWIRGM